MLFLEVTSVQRKRLILGRQTGKGRETWNICVSRLSDEPPADWKSNCVQFTPTLKHFTANLKPSAFSGPSSLCTIMRKCGGFIGIFSARVFDGLNPPWQKGYSNPNNFLFTTEKASRNRRCTENDDKTRPHRHVRWAWACEEKKNNLDSFQTSDERLKSCMRWQRQAAITVQYSGSCVLICHPIKFSWLSIWLLTDNQRSEQWNCWIHEYISLSDAVWFHRPDCPCGGSTGNILFKMFRWAARVQVIKQSISEQVWPPILFSRGK